MAIATMKKFNILAFIEDKDKVLKALQSIQSTELFSTRYYYDESQINRLFSGVAQEEAYEETNDAIRQINWALHFLAPYLPTKSFLATLKETKKTYSFEEIDTLAETYDWQQTYQQLQTTHKRLQQLEQKREAFLQEEENLHIWQYFDENPNVLASFTYAHGDLGTIANGQLEYFEQTFSEMKCAYYEVVYRTNTTSYIYVLYHKERRAQIQRLYQRTGFTTYKYPFEEKPSFELTMLKSRLAEISTEEKQLKKSLGELATDYETLQIISEKYYSQQIRETSDSKLMKSDYMLSISGWVSETDLPRLQKALKHNVGEQYYFEEKEIDLGAEDIETIPIKLENNKWIKPFESIIRMYSLPRYDEIDPTPFIVPFYLIFFGMMVADFGYGLALFTVTTLGKLFLSFSESMEENISLFQMLAIPTMLWGLVYGTFFGFEMPWRLLSPTAQVNEILLLALAFGVIQILTGLILKFYILWRKQHKFLHGFLQAGGWFFFLISLLVIAGNSFIFHINQLQTLAIGGALISLVLIILGGTLDADTIGGKIGNGLYGLMDITSYVGDIISYSRLMALGIAGGSIASAFNLIITFLPPVAQFTVGVILFIILHGLNIFLSYLSAYVHGLRLQYVEFFGKFHTGGGRAFMPFKAKEQHIQVRDITTED